MQLSELWLLERETTAYDHVEPHHRETETTTGSRPADAQQDKRQRRWGICWRSLVTTPMTTAWTYARKGSFS